jgi:Asp-tRNA(Asn)/Glu-tRNA(Gln) amidotransferase A subunit family amidase
MRFNEYADHDAVALAALVRKREVRLSQLTEAAIERSDAFNPAVNAVVQNRDARRHRDPGVRPDQPGVSAA